MKKPAVKKKAFKPVPVATQIARHRKAVVAAKKAAAKPAPPLAAQIASAKKAAATRVRKRAWSPDEDVALCSARAVAESLRIALGVPVSHDDVLALHRAAGGDDDAGASLAAALMAAETEGLAGYRPRWTLPGLGNWGPLVVGVLMPGGEPHSVAVDIDRWQWWSWGEMFSPAGCTIEEAWAVTWS